MGLTTLLVVPGMTVLFTMTVGCLVEPAMASPIDRDADSTCERSISPDMLLGVPTVMKTMSESETELGLVVHSSLPFGTCSSRSGWRPVSRNGAFACPMSPTLAGSRSMPVTWNFDARHAAVDNPTYPSPTIAIRASSASAGIIIPFAREWFLWVRRPITPACPSPSGDFLLLLWRRHIQVRALELQPSSQGYPCPA